MIKYEFPSGADWRKFLIWLSIKSVTSGAVSLTRFTGWLFERITYLTRELETFLRGVDKVVSQIPTGTPQSEVKKVEALIDVPAREITGKTTIFFDWDELKNQPNKHPNLRLIASPGAGKTRLLLWLLTQFNQAALCITPKGKREEFGNFPVVGIPFDYERIDKALELVHKEMVSRYEDGVTCNFLNVAIDEWRLITTNKDKFKVAPDQRFKELITLARESKIRILAVAQSKRVKSWGLEEEGDLESAFTTIFLGSEAIDEAYSLKLPEHQIEWLEQQSRPCLVGRTPAVVPDLSSFIPVCNYFPPSSFDVLFQAQDSSQSVTTLVSGERVFEGGKTPETTLEKSFSNYLNAVGTSSGGHENCETWREIAIALLRDPGLSDSELIKKVWGTKKYSEGRRFIELARGNTAAHQSDRTSSGD